jgi:phenylpropionate dioxygenase-like ring-hydroxylating dioxygenase large terminal subunit
MVSTIDYSQFVHAREGVVDRRIFSDSEIYTTEMERIFARAWNFMCHESQIPEIGDFFMNRIGDDQVIAVRNKQKGISVLLNSCRHRGNAVCRAEQGRAKTFICPYHGWSYGLDGELIGVPGLKDFYRNDLKKDEFRLGHAAKVKSYKGLVFATMDPQAPPLEEYLGEVGRLGLDMVAERGEVEVVDGVQKNIIDCNWKIAVDNLFDWYHPAVSHKSAIQAGFLPALSSGDALRPLMQMVMLGEYGHAISGPRSTHEELKEIRTSGVQVRPSLAARAHDAPRLEKVMGRAGVRSLGHPNIFPNLWITLEGSQLCLRLPRGPLQTELWWFTFVPKHAPESVKQAFIRTVSHIFGPAGLLEQDDGENWQQCTRASVGALNRRYTVYIGMGLRHDEVTRDGGQACIETVVNEHGQRWTYQAWSDWMMAKDWQALKTNHTAPPTDVV